MAETQDSFLQHYLGPDNDGKVEVHTGGQGVSQVRNNFGVLVELVVKSARCIVEHRKIHWSKT